MFASFIKDNIQKPYLSLIGLSNEIPSDRVEIHHFGLPERWGICYTEMKRNFSSFFIKPITHIEIEEIISSFRKGKSTVSYSIPVKLLKILSPYISQPLAIIFNASVTLGTFPDKLKHAEVILFGTLWCKRDCT